MRRGLLFAAFLATGPILSADVVTSVTCTIYPLKAPYSTITDPSSCVLQNPAPYPYAALASATANASFSLASDLNGFSALSVNQDALARRGSDGNGYLVTSTADSQVSVNEALFTPGSVRSGFVQINATGSTGDIFREDYSDLDLSLGPIGVGCINQVFAASLCVLGPNGGVHNPPTYSFPINGQYYPFTLGQAFNFSYSGTAAGFSDAIGDGEGSTNMQFQFRFFEADGVTPVAVEAAPEPGSLALLGVALGMLAVSKSKFLYRVRKS